MSKAVPSVSWLPPLQDSPFPQPIHGMTHPLPLYHSHLLKALCYFPGAATGLKRTEIDSLTVQEARSLKLRYQEGCAPSRGPKEESFLASPSSRQLRAFPGWWQRHSRPCLHCHTAFSPASLCQTSLCHSLVKTPVIGFGAKSRMRFHCEIPN